MPESVIRPNTPKRCSTYPTSSDYPVAWFCQTQEERQAALKVLDQVFSKPEDLIDITPLLVDFGCVNGLNIVIILWREGKRTHTGASILEAFPSIITSFVFSSRYYIYHNSLDVYGLPATGDVVVADRLRYRSNREIKIATEFPSMQSTHLQKALKRLELYYRNKQGRFHFDSVNVVAAYSVLLASLFLFNLGGLLAASAAEVIDDEKRQKNQHDALELMKSLVDGTKTFLDTLMDTMIGLTVPVFSFCWKVSPTLVLVQAFAFPLTLIIQLLNQPKGVPIQADSENWESALDLKKARMFCSVAAEPKTFRVLNIVHRGSGKTNGRRPLDVAATGFKSHFPTVFLFRATRIHLSKPKAASPENPDEEHSVEDDEDDIIEIKKPERRTAQPLELAAARIAQELTCFMVMELHGESKLDLVLNISDMRRRPWFPNSFE